MDEARKMAKDAIAGYVASLLKHKEPIPADEETLVTTLDRECARVPGVRPREVIRFLEKHGFSTRLLRSLLWYPNTIDTCRKVR